MRTVETFQSVTRRYAEVMGRKLGVAVTFGGETAFTYHKDGKYGLNVPAMPAGTVMTVHQAKVYGGYVDHETAHLRWTDFVAIEAYAKKGPLRRHLQNVIEDIRIENIHINFYTGCRPYLDALAFYVDREIEVKEKAGTKAQHLMALIYKECWAKFRNCYSNTTEGQMMDYPELVKAAEWLHAEVPKLACTKEVAAVVEGLLERLPKGLDWEEKVPPQGGSKPENKKEDGPQAPGGADLFKPESGKKGNTAKALEEALAQEGVADQHEVRAQMIRQLVSQIDDHDDAPPIRISMNWSGNAVLPPVTVQSDRLYVPGDENMAKYISTRDSIQAEILAAKKMLGIYLRSRKDVTWTKGLEEGVLDAAALHQVVTTKSTRVMKQRRPAQFINTAVELTVDLSQSMSTEDTRAATILVAEALNGIRWLKLEITGFKTNDLNESLKYETPRRSGGRLNGLEILLYKHFDESYEKAKPRLGALRCHTATPLGDAYGNALERVAKRRESRRVIWLISDGDPAIDVMDPRHNELLSMQRTHKKCRDLGIETIGTYVGRRGNLEPYVDRYSQALNSRELGTVLMNSVKDWF